MCSPRTPARLAYCAALAFPTCFFSVLFGADGATPEVSAVRNTLAKATAGMQEIAVEGGYVWRVSVDLTQRFGEGQTTPTQIWVQPPGTPSVGMAFLRAHAATGDRTHLDAARAAALALVRGQLESGGWDYLVEFDPEERPKWRYRTDRDERETTGVRSRRSNRTTFDDDNTQSVLRFLLAFLEAAKAEPDPRDEAIAEARDFGLRRLMEAQYPIGAWPQRWDGEPHDPAVYPVVPASYPADYPREQPKSSYYGHYTLNDNTHRDCVVTLLEAHRITGRPEYREAARRGVDFLVLAQMPEPQRAWAQQYDAAMHPAWARAFEPPAITASESAGAIRLLLDMYLEFGDTRYLAAAEAAAAWLRASTLSPGRWARLYELHTNRPIYGDRDGRIHYTLDEISEERRTGYGWEGGFTVEDALRILERIQELDRDDIPAAREARTAERRERAPESAVNRLIAAMDANGRWTTRRRETEWIDSAVFARNVAILCSWLETAQR